MAFNACRTLSLAVSNMRLLSLLLLSLIFSATASENLSDHQQFCADNPQHSCAQQLQQALLDSAPYSNEWYRIKAIQLNYLFDKHHFQQLQLEVEQLLPRNDLPEVFQVQLYFYYAKTLNYFGNHVDARVYASRAVTILQEIYVTFGNPLRLVELANLQITLGELEQAAQLLGHAKSQYGQSKDPLFIFELNSNLALLLHQENDLAAAAAYRAIALDAAIELGQATELIVAYGNLARTRQLQGELAEAYSLYQRSLQYTALPDHQAQHFIHLLRLAEISLQLKQADQARNYLQQVTPAVLSEQHQQLYQKLRTELL